MVIGDGDRNDRSKACRKELRVKLHAVFFNQQVVRSLIYSNRRDLIVPKVVLYGGEIAIQRPDSISAGTGQIVVPEDLIFRIEAVSIFDSCTGGRTCMTIET